MFPVVQRLRNYTVETAREFALTSNNCTVNSSTNLNSIKSTVQCVNITRADPRVTHELFTMKLNSSKPQQPGTSKRKISHPSKKIRLIKMFDGIHRLFKQSLSQSSSHCMPMLVASRKKNDHDTR